MIKKTFFLGVLLLLFLNLWGQNTRVDVIGEVQKLFNKGDYLTGIDLLERELKRVSQNEQPQIVNLILEGWVRYLGGKGLEERRKELEKILSLYSDFSYLPLYKISHFKLAMTYLDLGFLEDAEKNFYRILHDYTFSKNEIFWKEKAAILYLKTLFQERIYDNIITASEEFLEDNQLDGIKGDIYYYAGLAYFQKGNNQLAREYLEKASRLAKVEEIKSSAKEWLQKAEQELAHQNFKGKKSSTHFKIHYEKVKVLENNERLVDEILEIAENAYRDVGDKLNYYPVDHVVIYIYEPENFYASSALALWAGACYDSGRLKFPLSYINSGTELLKKNIYHEYTHFAISQKLKGRTLPLWFNEGCAVNFSEELEGSVYEKTILSFKKQNKEPLPVNELSAYFRTPDPRTALLAYAYSAFFVHYLIEDKGERIIQEIIEDVAEGEDFPSAFYDNCFTTLSRYNKKFFEELPDE